jgi:hypothetical protein
LRNRTKICGAERNKQEDEHRNKEATLNAEEARGMQGCRDAQKWLQLEHCLQASPKMRNRRMIYIWSLYQRLSLRTTEKNVSRADRQTARPPDLGRFISTKNLVSSLAPLCCAVLCCAVLCCAVLCCGVVWCALERRAVKLLLAFRCAFRT